MFYRLISDNTQINRIYLYRSIDSREVIKLKAGSIEIEVEAYFSSKNIEYEIIVSKNLMQQLYLPTDILYQVRIGADSINIGPVIGLLLKRKSTDLTIENFNQFMIYTLLYSELHGLIYVFCEDSIIIKGQIVEGYYYNPNLCNQNCSWQKALLPMAGSIYRRVSLPKVLRKELIRFTKNNMFNSYYFDKREFYTIVSENAFLKDYVPETKILNKLDDIDTMIQKYGCVYIKSIDRTKNNGLVKTSKNNNVYIFQEKFGESLKCECRNKAEEYIKNILKQRNYIVQRSVGCLKLENRNVDFRVIMQKDNTKGWQCTGIVAYIGKSKEICSKYQAIGNTLAFEEALARIAHIQEKDIFIKRMEVVHICCMVCDLLESKGENYGDLGIDMVIDESLKAWIIGINKRHDYRFPLSKEDYQMYYAMKTNPIKYASALCGF